MKTRQELTPTERGWLEHLRRAEDRGVSLVQYARTAGVKVGSLYEARRTLRGKGVVAPGASTAIAPSEPGEFIPVQVIAPAMKRIELNRAETLCRFRHPDSGWVIECTSWPQLGWVRGLLEPQR